MPPFSLIRQSLRSSFPLLMSCCLLLGGFMWLRIWIASQIDFDSIAAVMKGMPSFLVDLLPVPVDALAAPLGRVAFGFEEMPVILLAALWAITRGSECIAGRVGDGTMEMLLAQPRSRLSLLTSHAVVTVGGALMIGLFAYLASGIGIATSEFDERPALANYWPAATCLASVGVFLSGVATLISAEASSRSQAVAVMVGFYFLQVAMKIVSLLSPDFAWLGRWTFLSAYEPTMLTVGLQHSPKVHWPLFWQYSGTLAGLGLAAYALAALVFCRRDVPAPL